MRNGSWVVAAVAVVAGSAASPAAPVLVPAVAKADLDPAGFREWVGGKEAAVPEKAGPQHVVAVRDGAAWPGDLRWNGVRYGVGPKPGPRHLRVGFTGPVAVGTVLLGGGGRVSVLKADAAYPGDLGDDAAWVPAERLAGKQVVRSEVAADRVGVWVLPPGTTTRAVRISHDAEAADKDYFGHVSGLRVFAGRFANVAPQAVAAASANGTKANLLNNESADGWGAWDNWDDKTPPAAVADAPPVVTLTWADPVPVRGLAAIGAGFGAADVQVYTGPKDRHPKESTDADWRTVATADKVDHGYPFGFAPHPIDLAEPATTRAVRLRFTKVGTEGHPHMKGNTKDGRRVWVGDLLVLRDLGAAPLTAAVSPDAAEPPPPIPVRFATKEPGYVTLVIDDAAGNRVRNLVSETWYPAGNHVAWWDGRDDLERDGEAARHGIYHVPGKFVAPGTFRVRGLWGPAIDLRYEFPVYTEGNPAWPTADRTGGWLSNHSPPSATLFVPGDRAPGGKDLVLLGSFVSEGTYGLAWVDLAGKVVGGSNWVGGNWTGAPLLARDDGPTAVAGVHAYAGATWEVDRKKKSAEVRVTALIAGGERPVLKHVYQLSPAAVLPDGGLEVEGEMGGLAVRNGTVYVGLRRQNQILVVDATKTGPAADGKVPSGKETETLAVDDPRSLAVDAAGRLLVLSGKKLVRRDFAAGKWETLIAAGLDDPRAVSRDADGNLYVSDWGAAHQVKVFTADVKPVRTVGTAGGPRVGPYDPDRMHHPLGTTVDSRGRLWVAEKDEQPKRVSVWTAAGKLDRAFYGPMEYGGGGVLDPRDPTRFYYLGMEFALDWDAGKFKLKSVFDRRSGHGAGPDAKPAFPGGAPVVPLYRGRQQYFTNCYHTSPVGGPGSAVLWRLADGKAVACGGLGRAADWPLLKTEPFAANWPGGDPKTTKPVAFLWADANDDGVPQPDEVKLRDGAVGGVGVMPDLAFAVSRFGDKAVRLAPAKFTSAGTPLYAFADLEPVADGVLPPHSSGGDQLLVHPDGWSVLTLGVKPLSPYSVSGVFKGKPRWSYPNMWPGLHASHEAPVPDRPGMLVGPTRLLGGFVTPTAGDAGPLWVVNANMGAMYVFTADGLFVRTLFGDARQAKAWSMPTGPRGMRLNGVTSEGENFWPSVTQTADGRVFLCDGARGSLVRVDHLDSLRRLPDADLAVTAADLTAAQAWHLDREAARQKAHGRESLKVVVRAKPPTTDGKLDDWAGADWATIDKRGVAAWFDSGSRPYDAAAAVAVAGDRLHVAFRCGERNLLLNSGESATAPFKTGGALDLMLAADPKADPKRTTPAAGDIRLLVTLVPDPAKKGSTKPLALVYRAVVPGTADRDRVPFASPWRTVYFDRVDDVTADVRFATADGNFEISVPLKTLGLDPTPGITVRGDLGILRGNGFQTMQRAYWSNKATGIVNDVPSEAALTPHLWGKWEIVREK